LFDFLLKLTGTMVLGISILGPGAITTENVLTSCAKFQVHLLPQIFIWDPRSTIYPRYAFVRAFFPLDIFAGPQPLSGAMMTVPL
jgi:hypothetical protein